MAAFVGKVFVTGAVVTVCSWLVVQARDIAAAGHPVVAVMIVLTAVRMVTR